MSEIPPIDRDSWLFLRDLPPDTPEETNNSPGAIKRILDNLPQQPNSRNRSRNPNTVEYVHEYAVINNVDPSIIASEPNYGSLIGNGHQTFYHESLEKLILRVPSRACEMAKEEISFLFGRYLAERGLDKELGPLGETMFVDPPYWKEASESWISAELADGEAAGGEWPSVVLEVGYCYERLRTEAAWWLRRSEGEVKAVIILEVSPRGNRPKLHIEHWRPEMDAEVSLVEGSECARSPAVVPRLMQCMTVEEGDGCEGTVTSSMPLTIPFAGIFRREPRNEQETDLVISTHDMEQIALRLWRSLASLS